MDAQEKEIDRHDKDDKNAGYDVDDDVEDDVNIEGLKLQDSFRVDDDVCMSSH